MKELYLTPKDLPVMAERQFKRWLCYLRQEIHEHILHSSQLSKPFTETFDISEFCRKHNIISKETRTKLFDTLVEELHKLEWSTKYMYGGVALLIFDGGKSSA